MRIKNYGIYINLVCSTLERIIKWRILCVIMRIKYSEIQRLFLGFFSLYSKLFSLSNHLNHRNWLLSLKRKLVYTGKFTFVEKSNEYRSSFFSNIIENSWRKHPISTFHWNGCSVNNNKWNQFIVSYLVAAVISI